MGQEKTGEGIDRRGRFRKGLHALYLPIYDALCEELAPHWQPYSGWRSIQEQALLFNQGRTSPGKIVTWKRGGESAHNYGCATDWTLWDQGKPLWSDQDPRWSEYKTACEKVGARWGGTFEDFVHNELRIGVSWKRIREVLDSKGLVEAEKALGLAHAALVTVRS